MDLQALKTELLAGHPVSGAYGDDETAANEIEALNRPGVVSIQDLLKFLILENTHKTDGTDTQDRSIWTRMKDVDALAVTPTAAVANPWGSTAVGTITEIQQIKTKQLLEFFTLSAQGSLPVDLTDSNFQVYLAGAESAGCMSAAQETALLALADNLQSRSSELSLGAVRTGDVTRARGTLMALPQFRRYVLVNNSGQTLTFNNNGRINIIESSWKINTTTGAQDFTDLTDDDMGFIAAGAITNGAEIVGDEIDNTTNKYHGTQIQIEITHDEGAAADGNFDLFLSAGQTTATLPTDASGYAGAEANGLTWIGSLIWESNGESDEVMRSNVFNL